MKNNYLKTDLYKQDALKRVIAKNEENRTYPINKFDLLTLTKCPLCKCKNTEPITQLYINYKLKILSTDICNDCLFVFRSVSPNLDWFKKCWKMIETKNPEIFSPKAEKMRGARYKKYYEILSKYVKSGKVLDVGAAYGTGAIVFKNHGFHVDAVEPEINKINYLKHLKIPVVADAIENLVTKKRNYDLILFAQCFEHIDHPDFIMSEAKNLLHNKNSILYFEIPIMWNYVNWSDALYLPHKSNFHKDNIINLMTGNGFEILEMFYLWHHSIDGKTPADMGIILKYVGKIIPYNMSKNNKFNSENIRSLYQKGLPIKIELSLYKTIKYSVPHIEQFFQTLRFKNKRMIVSRTNPDFLTFENTKED